MMLFYFLTHIYKKKSKFDESLLLENARLIPKEHFIAQYLLIQSFSSAVGVK